MNISITFRQMDATDAVKGYAHEKIAKLQKFLRQPLKGQVTLSCQKTLHMAEVDIHAGARPLPRARDERGHVRVDRQGDRQARTADPRGPRATQQEEGRAIARPITCCADEPAKSNDSSTRSRRSRLIAPRCDALTDLLSPERVGRRGTTNGNGFARQGQGDRASSPSCFGEHDGVPPDEIERVLLEREALQSTGIGEGVAIPHGALRAARRSRSRPLLIVPDGRRVRGDRRRQGVDPLRGHRPEARDRRAPEDARPRLAPPPQQGVPRHASSARRRRASVFELIAARRRRARRRRERRRRERARGAATRERDRRRRRWREVTVGRSRRRPAARRRAQRASPARRGSAGRSATRASRSSGLALAGHFYGVVPTRVQVLGETELSYLDTLDARRARRRGARLLLARALVRRRHARDEPPQGARRRPPRRRARRSSSRDARSSRTINALHARARRSARAADDAPRRARRRLRHRPPPPRQERHRQERVRARARAARPSPRRRRRREVRLAPAGHGLRRAGRPAPPPHRGARPRRAQHQGSLRRHRRPRAQAHRRRRAARRVGRDSASTIASASTTSTSRILGTPIRELVTVPVRPGRDMGAILEIAARNELLRRAGSTRAREFLARLEGTLVDRESRSTTSRRRVAAPRRVARCRGAVRRAPPERQPRASRPRGSPRSIASLGERSLERELGVDPRRPPERGRRMTRTRIDRARPRPTVVVVTGLSGAGQIDGAARARGPRLLLHRQPPDGARAATPSRSARTAASTRVALGIDVRVRAFLGEVGRVLSHARGRRPARPARALPRRLRRDASSVASARRAARTRSRRRATLGERAPSRARRRRARARAPRAAPRARDARHRHDDLSASTSCAARSSRTSARRPGGAPRMITRVVSFGFKYGAPVDADLVFDVRFLDNPYFVPELKRAPRHRSRACATTSSALPETQRVPRRRRSDLLEFVAAEVRARGKELPHHRDRLHRRPAPLASCSPTTLADGARASAHRDCPIARRSPRRRASAVRHRRRRPRLAERGQARRAAGATRGRRHERRASSASSRSSTTSASTRAPRRSSSSSRRSSRARSRSRTTARPPTRKSVMGVLLLCGSQGHRRSRCARRASAPTSACDAIGELIADTLRGAELMSA